MKQDGIVIIGTELDTTGFEDDLDDLKNEHKTEEVLDLKVEKNKNGLNIINKLLTRIGRSILGISATTARWVGHIIKAIAQFGLIGGLLGSVLLFGMGLASAFGKAIEKNDELTQKIQYLKFSLESVFSTIAVKLVDVLSWIIDRVYDLLVLIGGLINLVFKVNIFANATAENFASINKNVKDTNKSATKLQKTIAGFDEMNVLNGQGAGSIGSLGALGTDINNQIDKLRDLSSEVETFGAKFKSWLLGGENSFEDALKKMPGKIKKFATDAFTQLADKFSWLTKRIAPVWDEFKRRAKNVINNHLIPLWDKFYESAVKPLWEILEPAWKKFSSRFEEVVIDPMKKNINSMLYYFAPVINGLIDMLNRLLEPFGLHIDHINVELEEMQENTKNEQALFSGISDMLTTIGYKLGLLTTEDFAVKVKTDTLTGALNGINGVEKSLKNVSSKTWSIATMFKSAGVSKETTNSWLDPLRNTLAKIGIKIPKLAKGTILNNPGRGVPIGGAIAGESGREAVLPLSDARLLEELGSTIGKYITINLTNETNLDGRTIARKVSQLTQNENFLRNR